MQSHKGFDMNSTCVSLKHKFLSIACSIPPKGFQNILIFRNVPGFYLGEEEVQQWNFGK